MKLGLISAILPDYTFKQVIDYVSSKGLECVEMCCWPKGKSNRRYAGVTHIDIDTTTDADLQAYLDYAKKKNVEISSLGYYPNPLDSDKETRKIASDHIMKMIDASSKMGINMITTFIGKNKNLSVEDNLKDYVKVWTPIVKYAESKKVRIAIENCPMYYTQDEWPGGNNLASTPYIWKQMFSLIKSDYLGLNFDPSHLYLIDSDYVKAVYEFKDKIFHVHFKDIQIYEDKLYEYGRFSHPALWHSPKLPGLGGIDFAAFASALYDIRYNGYACIEVEDRAFESCEADILKGINQSIIYMKQFV